MPRKKKKPAEDITMLDFELSFDDITMAETEGQFDRVQKLMMEDTHANAVWTIKSRLTIFSQSFGMCEMQLDFNSDKSIYVLKHRPSIADIYTNPDVRCLTRWSQMAGWKIPQPHPELVRDNMVFWKHMWETLLVDSDFLDQKYGTRKTLDLKMPPDDDDADVF